MQAEIVDALGACALFRGLSQAEARRLAALGQVRLYQLQEPVFRQGEFAHYLYVILEGSVALLRESGEGGASNGKVWTVEGLGRGRAFGCAALTPPNVHLWSALCQKETRLLALPAANVTSLFQLDGAIHLRFLENLTCLLAGRVGSLLEALDARL